MVKRPLFWTGVLLAAGLACASLSGAGGGLPRDGTDPGLPWPDGQELALAGRVADCELTPQGMRLYLNHIQISSDDNSCITENQINLSDQIILYTDKRDFLPGDELSVSGNYGEWEAAANPGQFDEEEYYARRDVRFWLRSPQIRESRRGKPSLKRTLCAVKHRIYEAYCAVFSQEQAGALAAITLGERSLLDKNLSQLYQESGISHILAISGLHISLLGMGLYGLLRRCLLPIPAAAVFSGTALAAYIGMVGWSASSGRACVMFLIWLGAKVWGKAYDALTALAAAALLLLFARPGLLLDSAFQLSFLALLSLLILGRVMADAAGDWPRIRAVVPGIALQAGMLPCTLYFFYQASPWGILVNLAVVPLMPLIMGFGMLGGLFGLIWRGVGVFLAAPCSYLLGLVSWLCRLELCLPGAVLVCGRPSAARIVLYYAVLAAAAAASYAAKGVDLLARGKVRGLIRGGVWLAALGLGWLLMQPSPPGKLEILCLDVGQGDGLLFRMPSGEVCMVDGGSSSESGLWEYCLSRSLKYFGVRTVDWWFVSHADQDHISGLAEYLEEYSLNLAGENRHGISLRHLVLPVTAGDEEGFGEIRAMAAASGIQIHEAQRGDAVSGGGEQDAWSFSCIAPDKRELSGDRNEDSLVLLAQYGAFRMLLTGDLEGESERRLAGLAGEQLRADVLKVGHHGSRNASSEEFLAQVRPQVCVISRGRKNRYGHPSPEAVERLEEAGGRILDTARCGSVMIETDGASWRVGWMKEGQEEPGTGEER